jgi:predicted Rossmann-fold nucleotide-binding protein
MTLKKIVSGGQTGVDRAALDGAMEKNFPVGGWCPKERIAEDGRIDKRYPLTETHSTNYTIRTEANVIDSDGTLIFTATNLEGGTLNTVEYCKKHNKPYFVADINKNIELSKIHNWLMENNIEILNIAGPRASKQPDIYDKTKPIIKNMINIIQHFEN